MIVAAVCAGIYLRGYQAKEKAPLIIHKDWANCIEPTADGGYIIAGVIWGMGGMQSAIYLVKTDAHGGKLWCKTFGQGDVNRGNSVQQTLDLGYIVAGTTWPKDEKHSDMVVVKTDPSGNEIWSRTYGGNRRDEGHSVRQTTDGGYIVAGQTNSFGNANEKVYLLKTDPEGNLVWSRSLGEGGRDRGESVRQTLDGGYIVAGTTWPFEATYSDICLLKTDPEGREIWHKTFGGRYGDHGFTVEQTRDGGYIVAGNTWPVGRIGQSRMVLLRTDVRGEEMWVKSFGGEGSTYGYSVCPTVDGGYVVAGKMEDLDKDNDDICLLKTYGDGVLAWRMTGACP
jgi:hypothetical protein